MSHRSHMGPRIRCRYAHGRRTRAACAATLATAGVVRVEVMVEGATEIFLARPSQIANTQIDAATMQDGIVS